MEFSSRNFSVRVGPNGCAGRRVANSTLYCPHAHCIDELAYPARFVLCNHSGSLTLETVKASFARALWFSLTNSVACMPQPLFAGPKPKLSPESTCSILVISLPPSSRFLSQRNLRDTGFAVDGSDGVCPWFAIFCQADHGCNAVVMRFNTDAEARRCVEQWKDDPKRQARFLDERVQQAETAW